jgi:hypothetical protein
MPAPIGSTGSTPSTRVGPIVDPTTFKPSEPYITSFPTFDAHKAGIAPPALTSGGTLRSVADWSKELSTDPMTAVRQVGAALWHGDGAPYRYKSGAGDIRLSVNEGVASGGGQCDWFSALGYYALTSSGRFKREDVMVGQVYANGGWHNVIFFKNPGSGKWDVLDYQNVVSVGADSPEDAMRKYFRNHELGVLYRVDDPNAKASQVIKVRSDHQATLTAALSQPGIDGAMNPSFGSTAGLNEGNRAAHNGLGASASGARVQVGDATADARFGPSGFDRVGAAYLTQNAAGNFVGVKGLLVRDTSGEGVNMLVAGEWWSIQKGHYIGIVGGAEARFGIGTQRMKGECTMTTIAPVAAIQGGVDRDVIGDDSSRLQWGFFLNGRFQLSAPFVLNAAARARVGSNANGLSPGGALDPSFLGAAALDVNAGTTARYRVQPNLTLSGTGVVRLAGQDPTLTGSPVAVGGQLDTRLSYEGDKVDLEAGASAGYGIYDRDVLWRVYAGAGGTMAPSWLVSGQVGAGQFMSGDGFANATLGLTKKTETFSISAGVGATGVKSPGQPVNLLPSLGINGSF